MPGSVVNLSVPGYQLPDLIAVDTNLIVERLIVSFPSVTSIPPRTIVNAQRTNQFFQDLIASNGTGIVTPTAFNEFIHVAIKLEYDKQRLLLSPSTRQMYSRPIKNWHDLYKQDPTILRAFQSDLTRLRRFFTANGLLFVMPNELGSIASGRTYDEELIYLVGTYGLDSNDAVILMEAQRYRVPDVISLDADLQRAQADFNIYSWL